MVARVVELQILREIKRLKSDSLVNIITIDHDGEIKGHEYMPFSSGGIYVSATSYGKIGKYIQGYDGEGKILWER